MELIKKSFGSRVKYLSNKIIDDNLFLLASSVSYYSALGLAPFVLILLGVAAFLGQDIQGQIISQVSSTFSPEVGGMVKLIFDNVNEGVNVGSISGIIGLVVLLSTASLVFLQMRYSFDVIYGYYNADIKRSVWAILWERIVAMFVVVGGAVLLIFSFSLTAIAAYLFGHGMEKTFFTRSIVLIINFLVYIILFSGIIYFTPSKRPGKREAFKTSLMSSTFFIIGNILLASYLKGVAADSVYGAAGSLLVFLVWSYYSSFTLFLSVEVFTYLKKIGKVK